jgi:putative MFS transporter
MSAEGATSSLIPARLERLPMTRIQWWIYWLCAAGVLFGSADIFTIFSIGASVQADFHLSSVGLGLVIGSAAPAGMLGAFVAGRLGDSRGRKAIFQYTLLLYFIGSIISGISPNFVVFLIGRLILGFGIGGELPTILALISEYVPRKVRGALLALINGMYAIGALIASNSALILVPTYGWRPLFFILAIPAVVILILRVFGLPESARWLEAKGRKDEAERVVSGIEQRVQAITGKELPPLQPTAGVQVSEVKAPLREVFSRTLAPITILLMWMWWITSFAGISLPAFYVPILEQRFDYSQIAALSVLAYSVDANAIGVAVAMITIEYVGRRPMIILTYILYGLFEVLLALTLSNRSLILFTIVPLNIFIVWNFSMILSYTPEIYPTRNRSSGNGVVTTSYNFSQFVAPLIIGAALPLLPGASVSTIFYIIGVLLILTAVPAAVLVKETKRKALEEITV